MVTEAPPLVAWEPTVLQDRVLELLASAAPGSTSLIGYGGAAGGAKTNLLANLGLMVAMETAGSRILIGRQDFIDLKTTTLQEFDKACRNIPGLDVLQFNTAPVYRDVRTSQDRPYSRVYFRGLEDWQSLMSEEFGLIIIDEAQETALQAVLALLSRLRHQPEKKWALVVGFNPFPGWCVDWFMRRDIPAAIATTDAVNVHFIQSRMDDNPHLRAGYKEMLSATLDPYLRAILVEGDPDAALDSMLYFDRRSIEVAMLLASDPPETIETRISPSSLPDGHVHIWERPLTGERYYIGADTADGKGEALDLMSEVAGPDRNAAAIYRWRDNVQVAAIYGRQEEHEYARVLDQYGRWYNGALIAVERNRRPVLVALRELNYPNLYATARAVDMHLQRQGMQTGIEYGWLTDTKSRPVLLADFREALSMRAIRPRDKALFKECLSFMAGEKPEASPGQHDDRVFAHAIAWQARKMMRNSSGPSPNMVMAV